MCIRDRLKALRVPVDGKFHILIVQPSCSMVIILYHTADRNLKPQIFQNLKCDIDVYKRQLVISTDASSPARTAPE